MHWLLALDYHHWLLAGLLLLVLELLLGRSVLLWTGLGVFVTGVLVLVLPSAGIHLAWSQQLLLWAALTTLLLCWRLLAWLWPDTAAPHAGDEFILMRPDENMPGYILVSQRAWPVTRNDLCHGSRVRVLRRRMRSCDVEPVS